MFLLRLSTAYHLGQTIWMIVYTCGEKGRGSIQKCQVVLQNNVWWLVCNITGDIDIKQKVKKDFPRETCNVYCQFEMVLAVHWLIVNIIDPYNVTFKILTRIDSIRMWTYDLFEEMLVHPFEL
jgi:hypothetical protein